MKKLSFILVVVMCVCLSIPAYAQSVMPEVESPETDIGSNNNPNANTGSSDVIVDDVLQGGADANKNAGQYSDIMELYQYWEVNGYPDYVEGVYSTDGNPYNLTVMLVNDDGSISEMIHSSLGDSSGVSFGNALYSHNALTAVKDEIVSQYLRNDNKVYSVGVGWISIDGADIGFGESGKESRVIVSVDKTVAMEYANTFYTLYGDMVVVEAGGAIELAEESIRNGITNPKGLNNWFYPIFILILCGAATIVYFNRTRLIPAFQTNNGTIVTGNTSVSKKQVITAIKNSVLTPSDDVFASIMAKIEKAQKA